MTLESRTARVRYVGNGVATEFAFPFRVWKPNQVRVFTGNGTADVDVTGDVSVTVTETGGTVTFSSAPPEGTAVVIRRNMPFVQEDEYENCNRFDGGEVEDRLDQDCAERQQLLDGLGQCVQVPETSDKSPREWWESLVDLLGSVEAAQAAIAEWIASIGTSQVGTATPVVARGTTAVRSLGERCADFVNLKDFGAKGDGETPDTAAWTAFQTACASGGLGYIPAGNYLVNGTVKHFSKGCLGNGYEDPAANFKRYDEPAYSRTIMRQSDELNLDSYNTAGLSPQVKLHTKFTLDNTATTAGYQRGIGISVTAEGNGEHPYADDTIFCNASLIGARVMNKFAGQFGMTGVYVEAWDVSHVDNEDIATKGASKVCGLAAQTHRNAEYAHGGYQIGLETMVYWHSIDGVTETVYSNNDSGSFTAWVAGYHCTATSAAQPITHGILMDCGSVSSTGNYGYWNGITIGGSCWMIDGETAGPAGTVGINLASWSSAKHAEAGIKFNAATRHLWFKSGAKIQSPYTRILNSGGSCVVEAMAHTGSYSQFVLSNGDASEAAPSPTQLGKLYAQNNGLVLSCEVDGNSIFLSASDGGTRRSYVVTNTRIAPTTHNACALGSDGSRWSDIYCVTGGIHDSDERLKQDIDGISDDLLDAWAGVSWKTYKFRDAVAQKGDAARSHVGVIAQHVLAAFEDAGLDASDYGFFCHDAWEDQYEETQVKEADAVLDANGRVIEPERWRTERTIAVPAGDRYAMRYEEALCLEAAYLRREIARIKARLSSM